ncbi:hypothetical protein ES708_32919 [subsurface metagenome]
MFFTDILLVFCIPKKICMDFISNSEYINTNVIIYILAITMMEKIAVLIDEPIQKWFDEQGRKFKISPFVRNLIKEHIKQAQSIDIE